MGCDNMTNTTRIKKMKIRKNLNETYDTASCHAIPQSILDELAARFLINVPEEEKHDLVRICFQLELCHWFYIDFYVPNNPELEEGTIQEFAAHMFNHVDYLRKYVNDIESIVENWMIYKKSVPVNGAVLLNKKMNKILMVKSFSSKATWAFPKGKINQEEETHDCAVREVYEETGYDTSALIDKDLYIEKVINDQTVRLYLIAGVEEDFPFAPRSRGEISDIRWWDVTSLPTSLSDKLGTRQRLGMSVNMFYNAIPFIRDIQNWVTQACVKKASWSVLEPDTDNRKDSVRPMNCERLPTDVSEPFCPESWKSFRFNLEDIENSFLSC